MKKQRWCLVGGNGAGKSTFYHRQLEPSGLEFVNADLIARSLHQTVGAAESKEAQEIARQAVEQKISRGDTFCFETVFSHISKVTLLRQAKAAGYEVNLVMIHLSTPQLNLARVHQRVEKGGHNVPADRVSARIPRMLEHVKMVLGEVDNAMLIDNSSGSQAMKTVAVVANGIVKKKEESVPTWAADLLASLET